MVWWGSPCDMPFPKCTPFYPQKDSHSGLKIQTVNDSDWLKLESYVRCAGRIIQKMKYNVVSDSTSVEKPLQSFVERMMESLNLAYKGKDINK